QIRDRRQHFPFRDYLAPDGRLMAAEVKTGTGFEAGFPSVGVEKLSFRSTIAGSDQLKLSPTQKHWKLGSFCGAKSIIAVPTRRRREMISFFRAHKRAITILLVVLGAFWLSPR